MSQERLKLLVGRAETAASQMADQEIEELRELVESCPRGLRVSSLIRSRRSLQVQAPNSLRRRLEIVEQTQIEIVSALPVGSKARAAGS